MKNNRKSITAILFAVMMITSVFAVLPIVQADINPPSVTLDRVAPGESVTISKTLDVPDIPPKLDLYLLEDETASFGDDIATLQTLAPQIFDDVRILVSDSRFGVGGFRDFPFDPWGSEGDWAYRRVQDMTADRATFVNGVNALTAGGGNDVPESQYEALYQAATGAGKTYSTYNLPPGQNPSFRDDAFKVIVLTTDAPFHTPPDYPGPSRDATVNALNSAGIIVIALKAPGSGSEMDDIAAATGGVVKEISDGSAEIAEAIVDALGEVLVDVTLEAACDPELTVTFSPSSWSDVDPPTTLPFIETVSVDSGFTGILLTCTVTAFVNEEVEIGTQIVIVNVNQPPVADANGPYVANEGSPITFDASGSTDPNDDQLQYRWDFDNNGIWDTPWSDSPYASHTWCDDHVGTAKVEVSDGLETDTATASVTVLNVAPTVEAGPDQEVTQGDTVYFSGGFIDPGCDTWTYTWSFGDGSPVQTGICTPSIPITATHIYTYPDVYTATLTVRDDDGGVESDMVQITVTPKYVDIDSEGVKVTYMLSKFGKVYYTRRANDNWWPYGTGAQQPPLSGKEYVGVASDGINQVYIVRDDGTVYYTRRANDNWRQYGTGAQPPLGNYVGIASDGINVVYILRDDGTVYYTTSANANWQQYGTGSIGPPGGKYVDVVSDGINQVYIVRDDGTVYYTTSASDNWQQYGTGSPQAPVGPSVFGYQGVTSDGIKQVYVLNENVQVYYTMRATNGWYRYGTGPQQPPIV
jgi:hypothetical protein